MTAPTIIRCSALSGWPDCPRRGAARLFRAEITAAGYTLRRTPRSIAALVGVAVHSGASAALREKAQTGALPPESTAIDAATQSLSDDLRLGDEIAYDAGPRGVTANRREAEHQAVAMTRTYHRDVAPQINALQIEERLEAQVAPDLILTGQPDAVAREPGQIRDLKTGVRSPSSFAPQIGGYSLLARSMGISIDTAAIDFVQRVAVTKAQPDAVTITAEIAPAEVAAASIVQHIAGDLRTFREGDSERRIPPGDRWSFLANPASNLCSEKWCPCWGVSGPHSFCHEWRSR